LVYHIGSSGIKEESKESAISKENMITDKLSKPQRLLLKFKFKRGNRTLFYLFGFGSTGI
jgi:hypothetical protein